TGGGVNCAISAATQSGTCTSQVIQNSTVTLTEAPSAGHTFTGWGGACTGTATTCVVTMSQAKSVTATFSLPTTFALTVTSGGGTGSGAVTATGTALNCNISAATQNGTCTDNVTTNSVVTLTATPTVGGHTFAGWGGACTGTQTTCQVTMSQARSVTASFTAPVGFTLTITSAGDGGSGTVTGSGINCTFNGAVLTGTCSLVYATGTVVTLTATAGAASNFGGWTGACTSGSPTCQVTMSQARSVSVSFVQVIQFNLSVTSGGGTGNGSVSGGGISCTITGASQSGTCTLGINQGTQVTLTATPSAGHTFVGWGGACAGTGTCVVTMSQARAVTASFNLSFTLTVTASSAMNGSGTVTGNGINCSITRNGSTQTGTQSGTCSASVNSGASVSLTATATTGGFTFEAWGNACTGAAGCSFTMTSAKTVTAKFNAPSLATVQSQLFGAYCTSCHGTTFTSATNTYNALVNKGPPFYRPSNGYPAYTLAGTNPTFIVPYSSGTSYTVYQVQKSAGAYGMPDSATQVPASIVTLLINWINGGAVQIQP
ncbi:MAG TPA: InlB B-repeat-containing protein, partial [Gemmatimonadaceae bacterium]|nr:InlB B-repeat-containing protein [Gemmatimonadaceae bacterium]